MKKFVVGITLVMLAGCNAIPQELRVDESMPLVNFAQVQQNDAVNGEQARWGGIIANVTNLKDKTRLEVVNFDLKSTLRPKKSDKTLGRFYVYADGLLDPMIYQKGKSVTVVGYIAGKELGKIGEHPYQYPVLKAKGIHLWKQRQQVDVQIMNDPYWNYPSYWGGYPYPRTQHIIINSKSETRSNKPLPSKNTNQIGR